MDKTVIIDNEFVTLWYYPIKKIIHHRFKKAIGGENFKEVLLKGLEIFKLNNADKWLSDDRLNSVLAPEDSEWAMTQWFPKIYDAGWKYWAIVMPDMVQAKLNMLGFIETYNEKGLYVEIFDDTDKALKWLQEQN